MRWLPLFSLVALVALTFLAAAADPAPDDQRTTESKPSPQISGRFEFEVIESYDAKYLGDTPGHIGRHGELRDMRPLAALGDPIYRDDEKIGRVTGLKWSRGTGSLDVEFDPEPMTTVYVGDVVWIKLGREKSDRREENR